MRSDYHVSFGGTTSILDYNHAQTVENTSTTCESQKPTVGSPHERTSAKYC